MVWVYLAPGRTDITRLTVALPTSPNHRIHVPTLAVHQHQTHDITPELELAEIPLLAQPEPAHDRIAGPGARFCGGDRALERVVVERLVTDERQTPNYPLLLLLGGQIG